jgi:hypothetical protein
MAAIVSLLYLHGMSSAATADLGFLYAYGNYYEVCTLSQTSQFAGARAWCFPGQYPDQLGVIPPVSQNSFPARIPSNTQMTGLAGSLIDESLYVTVSGFSGGAYSHVYRESGYTWAPADGAGGKAPLPDVPVTSLLIDNFDPSGNSLLAGTDIGVYASTDRGVTWSNFNKNVVPSVPVLDIAQNAQNEISIATYGHGAYRLPFPVLRRGRSPTYGEQCESGTGDCSVSIPYPSNAQYGDTVLGFFVVGGCVSNSDLVLPAGWSILGGQCVAYTGSATFWVLERSITPSAPVPSSGSDSFLIAHSSTSEGAGMMVAYSGVNNGSIGTSCTPYAGSDTVFTAPQIQGGHDGMAVQWFQDDPLAEATNETTYDDPWGLWINWTLPSYPGLSAIVNTFPLDVELFAEVPVPTNGSYGPWTATAFSHKPQSNAPTPPAAGGIGVPCSIVLPASG